MQQEVVSCSSLGYALLFRVSEGDSDEIFEFVCIVLCICTTIADSGLGVAMVINHPAGFKWVLSKLVCLSERLL